MNIRGCVRHLLEHWESIPFNQDNRRAQLAAQLGPVLMHIPSLVQHVGEKGQTRHDFHRAFDFDPAFGG